MRDLFTDGFDSFWHFVFGIFAFYFGWLILLFFAYQFTPLDKDPYEKNTLIDLTEFALGYLAIMVLYKLYPKNRMLIRAEKWFHTIYLVK
jgi:hypothetical protein